MPEENSFSSVSSPVPGPLSPPLEPINRDIGDLHDIPINDNMDTLSTNIIQSRSTEEVNFVIIHKLKAHKNTVTIEFVYLLDSSRYT